MRNILEITAEKTENISSIVEIYEDEGFSLISKRSLRDGRVVLTFEGSREEVSYNTQIEGQKGFIEFEDGTQSPLYIRREKNLLED